MRFLLFTCGFLSSLPLQAAASDTEQKIGDKNCVMIIHEERPVQAASWSGACVDGFAEGNGVMEWKLRSATVPYRFEGAMQKGRWHGKGYYKQGNVYQYEGDFKEGKRHGSGVSLDYTGRYEGSWVDDKQDGLGKMTHHLGGNYAGEWKAGKFHGKGTITYAGSRTWSGDFINGRRAEQAPSVEASDKKYRISAPAPYSIGETLASGTGIPFSRAYDEMSPSEKQSVREMYLLDDNDAPPYPAKGTKDFYSRLRQAQQVQLAEGLLYVHVHVDSEGSAQNVTVYESPDPIVNKWIAAVIGQEKFKPGVCQGKPCAMRFPISVMLSVE